MTAKKDRNGLPDPDSLYAEYGPSLFHYALSVLGALEDVEEVMQELFLKVVDKRRQLAKARSMRAYLFAMLRHELARFMRRRKTVPSADADLLEAPAEEGISDEDARQVERALAKLPPEQREVVVLKIYEGLTFREIAEVMNTSQDTAASRYRYAIQKLKDLLSRRIERG